MREFFVFQCDGLFYRCIFVLFRCGRSVLWFDKPLCPLVRNQRELLGHPVLPYSDDFACAPCPLWRPSTRRDIARAGRRSNRLFGRLGLVRHETVRGSRHQLQDPKTGRRRLLSTAHYEEGKDAWSVVLATITCGSHDNRG